MDVAEFNQHTAQYCAQYVVKKMTRPDDPRLGDRFPEFARMSMRPGIGHDAMFDLADTVLKYDLEAPKELRHGPKRWPLGRYLSRKLLEMTGQENDLSAYTEEMRILHQDAKASKAVSGKALYLSRTARKAESQLKMAKIRKRNETL